MHSITNLWHIFRGQQRSIWFEHTQFNFEIAVAQVHEVFSCSAWWKLYGTTIDDRKIRSAGGIINLDDSILFNRSWEQVQFSLLRGFECQIPWGSCIHPCTFHLHMKSSGWDFLAIFDLTKRRLRPVLPFFVLRRFLLVLRFFMTRFLGALLVRFAFFDAFRRFRLPPFDVDGPT